MDFFARSGNQGNTEAQFLLGAIYDGSKKSHVEKTDYGQASHWLQKASYLGHKEARLHLAKLILDGHYTRLYEDDLVYGTTAFHPPLS